MNMLANLKRSEIFKVKKLGKVATFQYGYTATANQQGEFRFIRITDIDEQGNISDKNKKYVDLPNKNQKKYLLKQEDLIVARTGSVGKTALFESNEKAVFASYLIRIKLNSTILPKYY